MAIVKLMDSQRMVIGHLIKDAEYAKVGEKKTDRTNLVVAFSRDKGDVIKCALWGKLAVAASHLKKYDCVIVTGEVQKKEYGGKDYFELNAEDAVWSQMVYVTVETGEIDTSGFTDIKADDLPF